MFSPSKLPLQFVYPAAYEAFVSILDKRGLQPFDVEAEVVTRSEDTCIIRILFGRGFDHIEEHRTNPKTLEQQGESLIRFFESVCDLCHDKLQQEYLEYMRMN